LHVQSIFLELYAGWVGNQKNQNKNNEKRKWCSFLATNTQLDCSQGEPAQGNGYNLIN
jgi:hypothetical protein